MKNLRHIIIMISSLLALNTAFAQQQGSIDANRMNRDINIMENILSEMFKVRVENETTTKNTFGTFQNAIVTSYGFNSSINRNSKGTYLPGFGVIFTISPRAHHAIVSTDHSISYSFVYGSTENENEEVTKESIVNRIGEFLRDYGSTIGQLKNDEKVMVIFGHSFSGNSLSRAFVLSSSKVDKKDDLPTVSIVAKKSDLDAYRSGRINDNQFSERLSVDIIEEDESRQLDMEVMSNILETAFKENRDEESFRIQGSVNQLKLDNFGALFFFNVRYTKYFGSLSAHVKEMSGSGRSIIVSTESEKNKKEKEEEVRNSILQSFNEFEQQLIEYMVDYGRTLKSLHSDHFVMVSVSVSSSLEEIPERMDIQVKKSVLESMDRGNISREQAINQVMVRKY